MSKVLVNINAAVNAKKFYEVKVLGCTVICRWGRIGTRGQRQEREFGTASEARVFAAEKVYGKMDRGYVVVA